MRNYKIVIKKMSASILILAMIVSMFQNIGTLRIASVEAAEEVEPIDVSNYATPAQLMDSSNFSLDSEKTGKTKLVYFGKGNREWYIVGGQKEDELVLMSKAALGEMDYYFKSANHPSYVESTETISIEPSSGTYAQDKTITDVYVNHYGTSDLRKQLIKASSDEKYFTTWQQNMLCETTYNNYDDKNKCFYTLTDKIYPLSVNSEKTMLLAGFNDQLNITISRLSITSWKTWLRVTYGKEYSLCYSQDVSGERSIVPRTIWYATTPICPVTTIDLKDVLWASTVPVDDSEANDILKFRYRDSEKELGKAYIRPDMKKIRLENAKEASTLVVQNSNRYYRYSIVSNQVKELTAPGVTQNEFSSFAGCKVWIEMTDDEGKTIATEAVWEDKYSITPDLFDVKISDSVYNEGTANLAEVNTKSNLEGIGTPSISYTCNGEKVESPENIGTYEVYVDVTEGINYKAVEQLYIGKYTIRGIPKATDFRYKAPADLNFDGTIKTASVSPISEGLGSITVKYKTKSGVYITAPKIADKYTVYVDVSQGSIYAAASDIKVGEFIIKSFPEKSYFNYTAPSNLIYDNSEKTATVSANEGFEDLGAITVKYKRSGNDAYMNDKPVDVGIYKVYASIEEGDRYWASDTYVGEFTVKKPIAALLEMTPSEGFTYNCDKKTVEVKTTAESGVGSVSVIKYKESGTSEYLTDAPSEQGIYEVYVDVAQGSKYPATNDIYVGTFTIRKDVDVSCFKYDGSFQYKDTGAAIYNGQPVSVNVTANDGISGLGEITVNYKKKGESDYLVGIPVDIGDYEIYASTTRGSLYNESSDILVGEFKIRKLADRKLFSYDNQEAEYEEGKTQEATVNLAAGVTDMQKEDYTIKYKDSSNDIVNNPCNEGDYYVYVDVSDNDVYIKSSDIYLGVFSIVDDDTFKKTYLECTEPDDYNYDGKPKEVQVKYKDGVDSYGKIEVYYIKIENRQKYKLNEAREVGNYKVYANIYSKNDPAIIEKQGVYITQFTITDTVKQFATKTELLSKFRLTDGGFTGRLKFGQYHNNGISGDREWYITGIDQENDNSLTLLARMPFQSKIGYNMVEYGYGDDEYLDAFDFGTEYNEALDNCMENNPGKSINGTMKSLLGMFEKNTDYFTTAEIGRMKATTVTSRAIKNSGEDLFTNVTGKLYLADGENKYAYQTAYNKTIYVGAKNIIPIDLSRIDPILELEEHKVESFWLRSLSAIFTLGEPSTLMVDRNNEENSKMVSIRNPINDVCSILPAMNLDMSQVIFASDANPAEGEGAVKVDDAMTIRYSDSSNSLGSGNVSEDKQSVIINGAKDEYLVVRSESGAYAKKVNGNVTINASDVDNSLSSYEGCQVWLEKTDKNQRETIATVITSTKDMNETVPHIDYSKKKSANFRLDSSLTSGNEKYEAGFMADYAGTLNLYDENNNLIAHNIVIDPRSDADCRAEIMLSLSKGSNNFKAVFTPYSSSFQGKLLGEYETLISTPVEINFEVSYKEYRTTTNVIYVSNEGTSAGKGSLSSPLDIYTAVAYAKPGQYIVLINDIELDKELLIPRSTSGTQDKPITIMGDTSNPSNPSDPSDPKIAINGNFNNDALIKIKGDYINIYNINFNVCAANSIIKIFGNNNTIEKCNGTLNGISFVVIGGSSSERACMWPSNNKVLSCTSAGPYIMLTSNIGFVAESYIGGGNLFKYCIATGCSKGFSFGTVGANTKTSEEINIYVEECVAKGNTNGFYVVGQSVEANLNNCIAYNNYKDEGYGAYTGYGIVFESYNGSCSNCTFYNNYQNILVRDNFGDSVEVQNCITYKGEATNFDDHLANVKLVSCATTENVKNDWFESCDTSIEPTIATDGSIDMNGVLVLINQAADGAGAILSTNPNPTSNGYTKIDECSSHNLVNGICPKCKGYMEDPTKQEINDLAQIANTYLSNAQKYTTKTINSITDSLSRVDIITDESSVRLREEIYKGIADAIAGAKESTATIVLSSNPADSGILSGGGRYAEGDNITLKAEVVDGYTFKGWYKGTETGGDAYSTNKSIAYEVMTDDRTVNFTALYSANDKKNLTLDVGKGSVTYSFNNGRDTGTWNNTITNAPYGKGTSFTVKAVPNDNSMFLYWINDESGRILSESEEYSFNMGDNLKLKACYKNETEGKHYVVFKDMNGTILWSGDVTDKAAAEAPKHGIFTGYEFDGWDKEFNSITQDLVITAKYIQKTGFTVNVTGGAIANAKESYSYGELVTATAQETDGAKHFSGWYDGDTLVSDKLSYSFYVLGNTELVAKYEGDSVLQQQPMVRMDMGSRQEAANDEQTLQLNVIWSITEGYSLVGAGLVRTYQDDKKDNLSLETVDGTNIKKNSTKITTAEGTYAFTLQIATATKSSKLYSKGYLIYKNNETGDVKTIYTDLYTSNPLN